jgi:hypothetical protein
MTKLAEKRGNSLYRCTVWCAILLLFAAFSPPTIWIASDVNPESAPQMTEGFSWLWIASALGLVALVALISGEVMRHRLLLARLSFAAAIIAFGIAAAGLTHYWIDLMSGHASVLPGPKWELRPAPFAPVFAVLAALGAGSALLFIMQGIPTAAGARDSRSGTISQQRSGP